MVLNLRGGKKKEVPKDASIFLLISNPFYFFFFKTLLKKGKVEFPDAQGVGKYLYISKVHQDE